MTSDEYDGNRPPRAEKLLLKIETADARQAHIEDETTGTISSLFSPKLFRRFKSNRAQTGRLKKSLDRCANTVVVVDDVDSWNASKCHLRPLGNLSTTLQEEAANLPRYAVNCFYGLLSHSPCAEFCSDGPPGDAHSFISLQISIIPYGPYDFGN